jgi:ankyrin repeat protein/tetratricopeptide (TPR) repeat protein
MLLVPEYHFEINLKNSDGNTPLHLAAIVGNSIVVKWLSCELLNRNPSVLPKTLLAPVNNFRLTPAHLAVSKRNLAALEMFFKLGAPLTADIKDITGDTIGHTAAYVGSTNCLKFLAQNNLFIEIGNNQGNTPLHITVSNDYLEATQFLVESKPELVNWDAKNVAGNTPIHLCAYHGREKVFNYLAKKGFDLTTPNESGDTPLHIAACTNHVAIIKILDEYDVAFDTRNHDGHTAADLANIEGINEAFRCINDCIARREEKKNQQQGTVTKQSLLKPDENFMKFFMTPPSSKQIEARGNLAHSAVPSPCNFIPNGTQTPGLARIHGSWILYNASLFVPPNSDTMTNAPKEGQLNENFFSAQQKAVQAAIEGVSLPIYSGRMYCKATRYVHAAMYQRKILSKATQDPSVNKHHGYTPETIVGHFHSAQSILSKLSLYAPSVQYRRMIVILNLAAEYASLNNIAKMRALDDEAMEIYSRFKNDSHHVLFQNDSLARAFNAISCVFETIGDVRNAYQRKLIALEGFGIVASGRDNVNVAALLSNVGLLLDILTSPVYRQQGLAALRNFIKQEDWDKHIATPMNDLSLAYKELGLKMLMRLSKKEDWDERIATAMNNLAIAYKDIGKNYLSLDYHRQVLELREKIYKGKNHERLAASFNNLGVALDANNQRDEGIKHLRRALQMNLELHPQGHRDTVISYSNLAATLLNVPGLLDEATELLEKAVIMNRNTPASDEHVAGLYNNLGCAYEQSGNIPLADEYKKMAQDIREKASNNELASSPAYY